MQDNNDHNRDDERDDEGLRQSFDDAVGDRDVRAGGVLFAGFGILLLVLLSFAIPVGLYTLFSGQDEAARVTPRATPALPPEPRLQTNEYGEWEAVRDSQAALLFEPTAWQYLDEEKTRARIPIDRAMDILVKRGMPVRRGADNFPIDREGFVEPEAADWRSGQDIQSGR